MPMFRDPINGFTETIIKPIAHKVTTDLMRNTILPNVNLRNVDFVNNKIEGKNTEERTTPGEDKLVISYKPHREVERTSRGYITDFRPERIVFEDKQAHFKIRARTVDYKIDFSIDYYSPSYNKIQDYITRLTDKITVEENIVLHNLFISFRIPERTTSFLDEVLTYKNELDEILTNQKIARVEESNATRTDGIVEHVKEDFVPEEYTEYLQANAIAELEYKTDEGVNYIEAIITLFEHQVQGIVTNEEFEISLIDNSVYKTTVNYTLLVSLPIELMAQYPYTVYNTQLSDRWLPPSPYKLLDGREVVDDPAIAIVRDRVDRDLRYNTFIDKYLNIPDYDIEVYDKGLPGYKLLASVLFTVNTDDYKEVFNLNELPEAAIDMKILDWIRDIDHPYLGIPYQSGLHIRLQAGNTFSSNALTIDENLDIRSKDDLGPMNTYRLLLYIIHEPEYLTSNAIQRLWCSPYVWHQYVTVWYLINYIDKRTRDYLYSIAPKPKEGEQYVDPNDLINPYEVIPRNHNQPLVRFPFKELPSIVYPFTHYIEGYGMAELGSFITRR